MAGIFVSYRQQDSGERATRLAQSLVHAFGRAQVLMDVEALRSDEDYAAAIAAAARASAVSLVVIGPGWLDARDACGHRRLDRDDDLIGLEVGTALARPAPVLLVLVGGATRPSAAQLPAELAGLARLTPIEIADTHWREGVERLVDAIEAAGGPPRLDLHPAAHAPVRTPARFRWLVLTAGLLLTALVVLGRWLDHAPLEAARSDSATEAGTQR